MERETVYVVAWSDEDGMDFKLFRNLREAENELCSLFEQQADEDYSDDGLRYYAEEWEPDHRDPYSEENEDGYRKRGIYWQKAKMKLEEEDAVLTEDTAYLRKNRFGERFDARIIPV